MEVATLALIFISSTYTYRLPRGLLSALCFVESNHRIHIMHKDDGGSSSLGVCQIKLATAKMMGFKGDVDLLMDPEINTHYAAKYLSQQFKRYNGDAVKAIAAYNTGTYKETSLGLPVNQKYVNKVFKKWLEKQ